MRELHHKSGGYLKKKSKEHLLLAIFYVSVFALLFAISSPRLPTHIIPSDFDIPVALSALLPLFGTYFSLNDYFAYKKGMKGEKTVKQLLDSEFGNEYLIINDIEYIYDDKSNKANIDHIVLAPNGIFVIETKATKGEITYKKDFWMPPFSFSPSAQARVNCMWVKKAIEDYAKVVSSGVWVEPIVVFSNDDAKLNRIKPEIVVLLLKELPDFIKSYERYNLTTEKLENIGEAILKKDSEQMD